ncbi:MAG: glycosyltransferase [Streptosporangiales bacterium]|nr:glycosyltransferase [Streptosporangiales bacterium]
MREPFSLLLAVHGGDRPDYLREAFRSSVDHQSRRPDQVVVVRDGPVPDHLARCLDELIAGTPVPVTLVTLERNGGLGPALDAGLRASHHDVVARMDADDVSKPMRFEVQMPLIEEGADIVGSALLEFRNDPTDPGDLVGRRTPPCDPEEIVRSSRFLDPFNHPTVIYRRSAVLAAGGYGDLPLMEDYWLFARMLANGARPANLAEPLVYYRVGDGAYGRRGGMRLLRSELSLQRRLRAEGFTTRAQYLRNVAMRGGYRLLPETLRRAIYRRLIATYGERHGRAPESGNGVSSSPQRVRDPR